MNKSKKRTLFIGVCVFPALLLFVIFMIIPTFNVFRISLYKWGGFSNNKTFVGFQNYVKLFKDKSFYQSFQNTILLIVVVTIATILFALVFAGIMTRSKIKGKGIFRIIFYIPNILSIVVISAIFSAIYNTNDGLINGIISLFRRGDYQPVSWLGNQKIVIYMVAIALIWQAVGYYMVMYMASMSAIPESLYESASLEGAGQISQFIKITIPLIWTNIRTTLTFFVISTINLSFLLIVSLTGGGPDGATQVFLGYMYKQASTNSVYGYGMAIGVIIFLFSFALAGIINAVTKREVLQY